VEGLILYLALSFGVVSIIAGVRMGASHGTTIIGKIFLSLFYIFPIAFMLVLTGPVLLPLLVLDWLSDAPLADFSAGEAANKSSGSRSRYIPIGIKKEVWKRDKGMCVNPNCGNKAKEYTGVSAVLQFIEFDHILPFSKGGTNTPKNLQLLCRQCNRKKSNKW
jgi:hypothetical protein